MYTIQGRPVYVNTESKAVNLLKRIKTTVGSWLFFPVARTARGYIRPDLVLVNGQVERHPEGAYHLEFRHNGKRIRQNAGKDAEEAQRQKETKEAELAAVNAGVPVVQIGDRVTLTASIAAYLEEIKLTKKSKTYAAYSTSLEYFQESCHKQYVQDIDRKDMLKFHAFLRDEKEQAPRSCWNKFANVMSFLKAHKVRDIVGKNDWPRYVEEEPEIYEKEDLQTFLDTCTDEERLWYEFFLMSGMREQEVMYTYWSDVNVAHGTVKVTHKPDRGWTPKAYREREIPVPEKLVQRLKGRKAQADKKCNLLFPTSGCRPKLDFLDCCKAIAERAGLNPEDFWLHKFRATFATTHLWNGTDLRTVQAWMGHKDIESTMRYLKPQRHQQVRERVNGAWD
jgi:integrase